MDVDQLIGELASQSRLLVDAARTAGLAGAVPSCPGWCVADLLRHVGEVHRWAAAIVGTGATEEVDSLSARGQLPPDDELLDWVTAGHQALVETLAAATSELDCWSFLPAPSAKQFWARRQLHETSVHRMDAELAAGLTLTQVPVAMAEDGIDELLTGFVPRRGSRLRSSRPQSLLVAPHDSQRRWWVGVSEDVPVAVREERPSDVVFVAPVGRLYPALWNRAPLEGEGELVELWRERVAVRWS